MLETLLPAAVPNMTERIKGSLMASPLGNLVTRIDSGITTIYSIPVQTYRKIHVTISQVQENAHSKTSKAKGFAFTVLHNIGNIAPELPIPSLSDMERITTTIISISSDEDAADHENPAHGASDLDLSGDMFSELLCRISRFVAEARAASLSQVASLVVSKVLFSVVELLECTLDAPHRMDLERAVGQALKEARQGNLQVGMSLPARSSVDRAVTGVVLSYHEREDSLPWARHRKIQRSMHYKMPLRPFQATVLIPEPADDEDGGDLDALVPVALRRSCTPQSFPASPRLRNEVLSGFSHYTEDVLYRARDELRAGNEQDLRLRNATFNVQDAHRDVILSCGMHCASRDGDGLHRSVRSCLPVQPGVPVYFEMNVVQCLPPEDLHLLGDDEKHGGGDVLHTSSSMSSCSTHSTNASNPGVNQHHHHHSAATASADPDVCIGLSTLNFPLNFLVGSRKFSVGLASSGHLVSGPVWLRGSRDGNDRDASYSRGSVVGVLVQVVDDDFDMDDHEEPEMVTVYTNFFIDGEPVVGLPDRALEMRVPIDVDVYPTLSILSSTTKVFGHFSTEDIVYGTPDQLAPFTGESVYALDGSLIYHESVLYDD